MGRLFWKFFLVLFLAQATAILGTGILFALHDPRRGFDREPPRGEIFPGGPPPFANSMPRPGERPPDFRDAGPGQRDAQGQTQGQQQGQAQGQYFPPPPRDLEDHRPMHIFGVPLLPLAIGSAASLVFAALLAWYFSKPIRSLRSAFDAVAQGRLDVRLAPQMGPRRDELADLGRDFDRMVTQLKALMDGQRRLFHDVSHELRSPLARMHAAIGLARQQPERVAQTLDRVEQESQRVDRLVSELLTLARLEAGAVENHREDIELVEFIDDLLADASVEAEARNILMAREGEGELHVSADAELLRRATENVLRNALKHSPEGSHVHVSLGVEGDAACIAIADEGPGVPEAALQAIFQPFFRAGSSADGHGLGLAIAQRILESLGGHMDARNRAAGGLEVRLLLPRKLA